MHFKLHSHGILLHCTMLLARWRYYLFVWLQMYCSVTDTSHHREQQMWIKLLSQLTKRKAATQTSKEQLPVHVQLKTRTHQHMHVRNPVLAECQSVGLSNGNNRIVLLILMASLTWLKTLLSRVSSIQGPGMVKLVGIDKQWTETDTAWEEDSVRVTFLISKALSDSYNHVVDQAKLCTWWKK